MNIGMWIGIGLFVIAIVGFAVQIFGSSPSARSNDFFTSYFGAFLFAFWIAFASVGVITFLASLAVHLL